MQILAVAAAAAFRRANGQGEGPVDGGATVRPPTPKGCIRREGTSEGAPEAVRQAVGGGCQSGWRWLLSVTNAMEAGTCRQGDSGWG